MLWISVDKLFEASRMRGQSRRREALGIGGTVRDKIGFEKKGERKLVPKRKRPKKKFGDLIARTDFKSKTKR